MTRHASTNESQIPSTGTPTRPDLTTLSGDRFLQSLVTKGVFLLLLCLESSLSAAGLERVKEGELDIIRIENRFLVVAVAAPITWSLCTTLLLTFLPHLSPQSVFQYQVDVRQLI